MTLTVCEVCRAQKPARSSAACMDCMIQAQAQSAQPAQSLGHLQPRSRSRSTLKLKLKMWVTLGMMLALVLLILFFIENLVYALVMYIKHEHATSAQPPPLMIPTRICVLSQNHNRWDIGEEKEERECRLRFEKEVLEFLRVFKNLEKDSSFLVMHSFLGISPLIKPENNWVVAAETDLEQWIEKTKNFDLSSSQCRVREMETIGKTDERWKEWLARLGELLKIIRFLETINHKPQSQPQLGTMSSRFWMYIEFWRAALPIQTKIKKFF